MTRDLNYWLYQLHKHYMWIACLKQILESCGQTKVERLSFIRTYTQKLAKEERLALLCAQSQRWPWKDEDRSSREVPTCYLSTGRFQDQWVKSLGWNQCPVARSHCVPWHPKLHALSRGPGLQVTKRCLWVPLPLSFPNSVFGLVRPCRSPTSPRRVDRGLLPLQEKNVLRAGREICSSRQKVQTSPPLCQAHFKG